MNRLTDILVPLDGSSIALKSLGVAAWLATRLTARLHILNAGEPAPLEQALTRLGVAEKYRRFIEVHQMRDSAPDAILAAIERYEIGLVVMTARGESEQAEAAEPAKLVGHVTREVIERSPTPVLVLPGAYREMLPWRAALVPLSGEAATDESLSLALHLAHLLELRVTVAHVTDSRAGEGDEGAGRYADEAHHEFAEMLNEMVVRACPMCGPQERGRIEAFHLRRGDIAGELLDLMEHKRIDVLVVGWHGRFMIGHAQVLKSLMRRIRCPVLLVKPQPREFRLKVGEAFE